MLPNPRCHPDGVRWPCGTGRSCTHVSPRRSRSQHPGMPGRMMMFSWASGCVQSQWRRVKGLEVPQRTRRCRPLAPELPRGSPYPGLPAGSPRPHVVPPPPPGWPQASPSPGAWRDAVLAPAGESQEGGQGTGPAHEAPWQRPAAVAGNGGTPAGSPSTGSSDTQGRGPWPS